MVKAEVLRPDKNPTGSDAAFITKILRDNADKAHDRQAFNDSFIKYVFDLDSTRIIKADNEYIGLTFLTEIEDGLCATLHSFLCTFDKAGNPTIKNYYKLVKHYIFDNILADYFSNYNILTLNIILPDYVETTVINGKNKQSPAAKIINKAGFKRLSDPLRNWERKNGKPIDCWLYQVHRGWFVKWQRIKQDYENGKFSIDEILLKYRIRQDHLESIAKKKGWTKHE